MKKIQVRLYKTCQKRMPDKGVFTYKLNRSHLTFFNYDHRRETLFCLSEIFIFDGFDSIASYMKY